MRQQGIYHAAEAAAWKQADLGGPENGRHVMRAIDLGRKAGMYARIERAVGTIGYYAAIAAAATEAGIIVGCSADDAMWHAGMMRRR